MIQKILALLMMLTMLLGMTACGTDGSREQVPEAGPDAQTEPAGQAEEEREGMIRVTAGKHSFWVKLEDNESAQALRDYLSDGDKTIPAENYGGFEKVCRLGKTIPANDRQTMAAAGDVMLYNGTQIVFFYGSNSWSYTRLGKEEGLSAEELEQILSGPETELTLSLLNEGTTESSL